MSNTVIKIENLSKIYRLGEIGTGTLSHDLNRWWQMNIRGKDDPYALVGGVNDRTAKASKGEHVAALKDINLEVKEGEVLGIIGKNGAGKSTLLKVLSRVTSPTTGVIKVKGRLASLLEVGTGFHPEMTGRENIYMNGTIMGMRKWEITRKLDEIVEFAGVAKYLDTPVKRYSSGMKVRLGFAVAAHLEPEILVVDEVLAVGDAEFQKKAIGKMQDVSTNDGRTVLFVSHNMQSVSTLTERTVVMERGEIFFTGTTDKAINFYLQNNAASENYFSNKPKSDKPYIKSIKVNTSMQGATHEIMKPLVFEFVIKIPKPIKSAALSYQVINSRGIPVMHVLVLNEEQEFANEVGEYILTSKIPKSRLYPDTYSLKVHFADKFSKTKFETLEQVCQFEVKVLGEIRDYYWYNSHATFIEDNTWEITKSKNS
ncbi:ABC transporter ATP-binding protein [Anaerophaga thermohalophila]|uniref:ABC transporter ATP-binding protein n=1 Tax=Anaerophaga thermohalophila TaxID=177400 RepID=UPI000237D3B1|nr:ABC transporter ATP-binding protein [Anaerophaga thermohalophila]